MIALRETDREMEKERRQGGRGVLGIRGWRLCSAKENQVPRLIAVMGTDPKLIYKCSTSRRVLAVLCQTKLA